eukprot:SAG31_NODE_35336_length_324_cov_0.831111_1_plen_73_part_00
MMLALMAPLALLLLLLLPGGGAQAAAACGVVTTFGNHRFAIPVPRGGGAAAAFTAEIEWRRTGNASVRGPTS